MKTLICFFLMIGTTSCFGQDMAYQIIVLEKELFPKNIPNKDTIKVKCQFKDTRQTIEVTARKHQPNVKKVLSILKEIRKLNDVSMIPKLITLQARHENYFKQEFSSAWSHHLFHEQFEILIGMELTLTSLNVEQQFSSSLEIYNYLKNYFYYQQVDGKSSRFNNIQFFSKTLKNEWNGKCIGLCSNILLEEKANKIDDAVLDDLNSLRNIKDLTVDEKHYYLVTLGKVVLNMSSSKVESVYIRQIERLDSLMEYDLEKRNPWIYKVIGIRGKMTGLLYVLDELSTDEILQLHDYTLKTLASTPLGKQLLRKKLIENISNLEKEDQKQFIDIVCEHTRDQSIVSDLMILNERILDSNKTYLQKCINSFQSKNE